MYKYYGVYDVKSLRINAFTENVTEKQILTSIKNQQVITRQAEDMIKFTTKQGHATNSIPFEEQRNVKLLEKVQQRDVKLLEEVQRLNETFKKNLRNPW